MVLRVSVMRVVRAAGTALDVRARGRRDAAHALGEVEGDALAHQDRPRAPRDAPEDRPRAARSAVRHERPRSESRGSTRAKTRATTGAPHATIAPRATPCAVAVASASMHASVVTSPEARSSARARSTIGSTSGSGSSSAFIAREHAHVITRPRRATPAASLRASSRGSGFTTTGSATCSRSGRSVNESL